MVHQAVVVVAEAFHLLALNQVKVEMVSHQVVLEVIVLVAAVVVAIHHHLHHKVDIQIECLKQFHKNMILLVDTPTKNLKIIFTFVYK